MPEHKKRIAYLNVKNLHGLSFYVGILSLKAMATGLLLPSNSAIVCDLSSMVLSRTQIMSFQRSKNKGHLPISSLKSCPDVILGYGA